ncbi:MAG: cytochrome B5, partial [Deltaproteobacteria bacterium]|nr:cytochrome B5 [Deltaproteobacteria bacterium]
MKQFTSVVFLFLFLILTAKYGFATEDIAMTTGHDCGYCHLDPNGGGELTLAGQTYLAESIADGEFVTLSAGNKIFRLIIGYLHIVFAVLWFGTILYVHIVLKPSYAEKGLPRGEKFVGVLSFWVVGISGLILADYRIESWQVLFDTRFGTLLVIKVALYLTMLVSAIMVIKVIGPRLARSDPKEHIPGQPFNEQTLRGFNGQEGKPSYFAYNGKVYDASNSRLWPGGEHMRRHSSGGDLTNVLPLAPHNNAVMERLPVVGDYIAKENGEVSATSKAF